MDQRHHSEWSVAAGVKLGKPGELAFRRDSDKRDAESREETHGEFRVCTGRRVAPYLTLHEAREPRTRVDPDANRKTVSMATENVRPAATRFFDIGGGYRVCGRCNRRGKPCHNFRKLFERFLRLRFTKAIPVEAHFLEHLLLTAAFMGGGHHALALRHAGGNIKRRRSP